jgi:hypothetical protein
MAWAFAKASVRGASHIQGGSPCQDASVVCTDDSGKWVVAVVSDGAGSAARAEEGAKHVSEKFTSALLALANELDSAEPGAWITDFVVQKVLDTRSELRNLGGDENIRDFHCTLVACLISQSGGFAIHIGDGAIFGQAVSEDLELISAPENGEYANETYFITESNWTQHLRVTPFSSMQWLFLCTDGGAALAMRNEKTAKVGFVYPVLKALADAEDNVTRDKIIETFISDPKADTVTADDKTLVFIMPSSLKSADIVVPEEFDDPQSLQGLPIEPASEIFAPAHQNILDPRKVEQKLNLGFEGIDKILLKIMYVFSLTKMKTKYFLLLTSILIVTVFLFCVVLIKILAPTPTEPENGMEKSTKEMLQPPPAKKGTANSEKTTTPTTEQHLPIELPY